VKKFVAMLLVCCVFTFGMTMMVGCGDSKPAPAKPADKDKGTTPADKDKGATPPKDKDK